MPPAAVSAEVGAGSREAAGGATVAVVCFGDLGREPRVHRQLDALRDRYRIIGVGFGPSRFAEVEFRPLDRGSRKTAAQKALAAARLLSGFHESYYWRQPAVRSLVAQLEALRADVIIAHDLDTLPAAVRHANGARILYDAHDYAPRQFEDSLYFRLFFQRYATRLCRRYIPRVDRMITVCDGLADAYAADTGVTPTVVTNARDFADLQPRLRGEADGPIRLVHHGAAIRSRRIEGMIHAMDHLDPARFELDFLLVENSPGYLDELKALAAGKPNVRFLPPVPMPELPSALNAYDVGVFLLEPVNFNYANALPNKLFEFVQARLAVAVSPSVEMARLVRAHGCGVVAETFSAESFAAALRGLDHARINELKQRSHAAAEVLSSRQNKALIRSLVDELVAQGSGRAP